MKADERKQIEMNSLSMAIEKAKSNISGRAVYYVLGTIILVVAAFLLYRYFSDQSSRARDEKLAQLANADTVDKLKEGMETHRGTIIGSQFKLQLARHLLQTEGIPLLGTDKAEARNTAAENIQQARGYFLELTKELKEKDQAALVQIAWLGAAQAEESLVGLPTVEGGSDYRGNIDNAVEYFEKAGSIFPEEDFSKRYKARAEMLRSNKETVVKTQREIYKPISLPSLPPMPGKGDPFAPGSPFGPKFELPPLPTFPPLEPLPPETPTIKDGTGAKPLEPAKVEVPALPPIPPTPPV